MEEGTEWGRILEAYWESPGVIQVIEAQGLSHTTATQLTSRGSIRGPFHRWNGQDSTLTCLVSHGGRKGEGVASLTLPAWAASS